MTRRTLDPSQRDWLLGELTQWVAENLVSTDQQQRILDRYESPEEIHSRQQSRIAFALTALAALLFGLAVLLLIGFNWEGLPRLVKLVLCVSVVGATHYLGFHLRRGERTRKISDVVFFLGCLFYGAGIWLVAQAYHLDAHYPDGVWWWAVGVLPFALCLDSLLLHLLYVVLLGTWAGIEILGFSHLGPIFLGGWHWPNGAWSLLPLALPGLIWAYRKRSPVAVGLYVPLFAWWIILQSFAWGAGPRSVFWIGSVGAILLLLAETHRQGNPMSISYRLWGTILSAGVLVALSFAAFWRAMIVRHSHSRYTDYSTEIAAAITEVVSIFTLLGVALFVVWVSRRRTSSSESAASLVARQWFPLALAISMAGFACWSLLGVTRELWILPVLVANLAMLGLSIYLIRVGAREERVRPFSAGILYFLIWAFVRYLDLFTDAGGMLGAAALFALCGAGLIVIARFWSRARAAREEHGTPMQEAPAFTGPNQLERLTAWVGPRLEGILKLTALFQVVLLVAMIVLNALPLLVGKTVRLKVVPVDPRDFFRGDYVILSYDLDRGPTRWLDGGGRLGERDRKVYVTIEPDADGRHWHSVATSYARPSGTYLSGRVGNRGIQFGIEAYYVQEGKGRVLEDLRRQRKLTAEVAVAPWGQAKLIRLVEEE